VSFGEIFTLRIVEWPESIKLEVFESGLLTSSHLSEVYVPLPDPQQTCQAPPTPESYQFTSNKVSSFNHTAVGSGKLHACVPFKVRINFMNIRSSKNAYTYM
jgi:coiled-coil and C2 domain-containing protein 2A